MKIAVLAGDGISVVHGRVEGLRADAGRTRVTGVTLADAAPGAKLRLACVAVPASGRTTRRKPLAVAPTAATLTTSAATCEVSTAPDTVGTAVPTSVGTVMVSPAFNWRGVPPNTVGSGDPARPRVSVHRSGAARGTNRPPFTALPSDATK